MYKSQKPACSLSQWWDVFCQKKTMFSFKDIFLPGSTTTCSPVSGLWETPQPFSDTWLVFPQNHFLSRSWLPCHWSHLGHAPSSTVICQPLPAEKWSFRDWRGTWAEIGWHSHLFGSGEYSQTAAQSPLHSMLALWPNPTRHCLETLFTVLCCI